MRKSVVIQILVNAIIVVGAWAGLMVMDSMAVSEAKAQRAATTTSILAQENVERGQIKVWKERETRKAIAKATKGMTCQPASKPFLTDKVLVTDDHPNVMWVKFDEALKNSKAGTIMVLAYCE